MKNLFNLLVFNSSKTQLTADMKADYFYDLGVDFANSGKYDEALNCYDKAIDFRPNDNEAWNNKGMVLYELGNYSEGIKCFDRAIELKPFEKGSWYN